MPHGRIGFQYLFFSHYIYSVIISRMFENSDQPKNKNPEPHLLRTFCPISQNTTLRGHVKQIGKYEFSLDQKLGSGLTSDAYLGVERESNKPVCIKIIDREIFKNQSQKTMLHNEIQCQQSLLSDYIVQIYDVYDTNSFCFVVTELCEDGDLYKLIKYSRYGLSERMTVILGHQLAQALLLLKGKGIVHRDIKSENVMLSRGVAKLGDFGFAIEEKDLKEKQYFSIGSPLYMSLQSLQTNNYSYASDIFSFGIVLYQMLHCQSPWQCSDQKQLIQKIKSQKITFKSEISPQMQDIIQSCLELQPENRGKIQDILFKLAILLPSVEEQDKRRRQVQIQQSKMGEAGIEGKEGSEGSEGREGSEGSEGKEGSEGSEGKEGKEGTQIGQEDCGEQGGQFRVEGDCGVELVVIGQQ